MNSRIVLRATILLLGVLIATLFPSGAGAQLIESVAGNGSLGFSGDGGSATNAQLNNPFGVAVDARGNIYIADDNNQRIRVVNTGSNPITVAGVNINPGDIETVAGNGTAGFTGDGGPALNAEINNPSGVAVDKNGNIYIADLYNYVVRRVSSNGLITTVAGNGGGTFNGDGPATSSGIYAYAVAVDSSGNLYIGDAAHNRIRVVNLGSSAVVIAGNVIQPGYMATVAGNGGQGYSGNGVPSNSAELFFPYALAVDSHGNIFICDTYNRMIRVVNAGTSTITVASITIQPGNIATVAGNGAYGGAGDGGPATSAAFADPDGVAVDSSGNIYVSDLESSRIRFIDHATGITSSLTASAGVYGYNGDGIPASIAQLSYPRCLAIDGSNNIYIADQPNQRIREIVVNTGSFSNGAATAFTVNVPGIFAVTTDNQPTPVLTVSGPLPSGVTFVDNGNGSGTLSGSPGLDTAGNYPVVFTADNSVFPKTMQNFMLNVYQPGAVPLASAATFLAQNTTSEGSWQGVYGSDGYYLAGVSSQVVPSYASFAVHNQNNYTWVTNTTDVRALQIPNSTQGIASTWYNTVGFDLDLNEGSNSHQFTIYALDWDQKGRSERVQILDKATGAPLDTRTISNFGSGVYLSWNISGHVQVIVTELTGANAVVSGVFFGGAGSPGGNDGSPLAFLTSYTTSSEIRNNYGGWIGFQFTVGANSLNVASLGRVCIAGDNQIHTVEVVSATTGQPVPGGSIQLITSGCNAGQFAYGSLSSPITLLGNATYYLVTQEFLGGDYWYDNRPITSTSVGFVKNGIYSPDGVTWIAAGSANESYGPPNFLYTANPPAPITVTVQASPSTASFVVDGVTYTGSQVFTWGATTQHTLSVLSPQNLGTGGQLAWTSWSDGGTATHTVTPSGAATFTATFSTQYLLDTGVTPSGGGTVSASPSSPTGYYNSGLQVQLTAAANPVCSFVGWSGGLGSSNPLKISISGPLAVTANFSCNSIPQAIFLSGYALNSPPLRNDYGGWVGMQMTVGANSLSASTLGRVCVAGSSGSHIVKFVNASTGADVPGGSATVNLAGCSPGQFQYAALLGPITLQASSSYYLVSQEVHGGPDEWYDHGSVSSTNDASISNSIYSSDSVKWNPLDKANTSYVPVNFLYSVVSAVPIQVTIQTAPSAAAFIVDGTTYSGSQQFSWIAGSTHTISAATIQTGQTGTQYAWSSWNDGGAITHSVSPTASTTYTATFSTQYLLTTSISPAGGGVVNPSPSSSTGYYTSGSQVQLMVSPNPICAFTSWSGGLNGNTNPVTVIITAPLSVEANFTCSGAASTDFVTLYGTSNPTLRDNFSGWVGMKLTVGNTPLSVSSVARVCVSGNVGSHLVKFVNATTGTDVPAGTATLNMAGCTAGQFFYGSLSGSITLQPNASYYLVSQEASGGDFWYDYGPVSTTIAAAVNSSVYSSDGVNWSSTGAANTSYVPVDFQYSLAPTNPAFVTAYNLDNRSPRNNFTGWVGMTFTVGQSGMVVNGLGRIFIAGNSGVHSVKLVSASTGIDVPGGSVTVSMSGGITGQFSYMPLATPITLPTNASYYLVSQEISGGDQWYDLGTVATSTEGKVTSAVYSSDGANWIIIGGPNSSYVTPNLK